MTYETERRGFRKHPILWAIVAALVIVAGYFFFEPYAVQKTGKKGPSGAPVPVVAVAVQKGNIDITDQALGTVTPIANITVRTQIAGLLLNVGFQEGQIVQAGDYLAQVDPRPYQMGLEQAEGSLQRDQALLKEAQLNLKRYKTLVAQDSIAKQQLDNQQSLVDQYLGTVVTDQGVIDVEKLNLTYCHITAPVTGRVGIRQVDQGNYVQTSDANGIVTLTQLQPISVLFTLPEDDLPVIMKRLAAGATLQATAFDRTQTTKLAVGKLISVDNQIDVTTGTIKIRAQFDNQDNILFPNQFVNVQLLVDTLKDTLILPSAAIQRGTPGTYVYLIKDDNTVTIKVVKLGPQQDDNIAITDGLEEGDKVVIDGADKLRDGAKITLPAEKTKGDKVSSDNSTTKKKADDKTDATSDSTPAAVSGDKAATDTNSTSPSAGSADGSGANGAGPSAATGSAASSGATDGTSDKGKDKDANDDDGAKHHHHHKDQQ